ncbi:phosphatidylinositol-3-phosphatase [soil metagenome]
MNLFGNLFGHLFEPLEPRRLFAAGIPRFDHVVVVIEENNSYEQIVSNPEAPYLNHLRARGASFTHIRGETHPSQPNYLYLFSGDNQGITDNTPPTQKIDAENLGGDLFAAGLKFKGFSQSLPIDGFEGNVSGAYERKHNPWVNFSDVPSGSNLRFERFPQDSNGYKKLPTISFVVPDEDHNMHDGPISTADTWIRDNVLDYANWAVKHNSLLIITWDESDDQFGNRIPTFFIGANVAPGRYHNSLNHLNVLRTLQDMYDLPPTGASAKAKPITDIWLNQPVVPRGMSRAMSQGMSPGFPRAGTTLPSDSSTQRDANAILELSL